MALNRVMIIAGDGHKRPAEQCGFVVMAGASAPTAVGVDVASAARLVTAGAVPFLRVTFRAPIKQSTMVLTAFMTGTAFADIKHDSTLVATVGGASNGTTQLDFRFFDAAAAAIEPPNGGRLSIIVRQDLGG
jgi:hypothetical protein